jgi:hypothetical protein
VEGFADYAPWPKRRPYPLSLTFTWDYFQTILAHAAKAATKSVTRMMVSKPNVHSMANGCLHDIPYRAGLSTKHLVKDLTPAHRRALYEAHGPPRYTKADGRI